MDLKARQDEKTAVTALIERAMQGDDSVWGEVYDKTRRYVYFIALKSLRNEQDAQDITQDVYIQVIRSIGQLYNADSFYGWLRRIIFSKCTDFMKKKKPVLAEDADVDLETAVQVDEAFLPESILDSAETRRMVMELVDALPDAQRQSVLFYYYDDMTVDQIAALMECSAGTVKSRLNYARTKIKSGVEEHERKGTKLYGVSALPILTILLHEQAQAMELPPALGAGLVPILGGTSSTIGTYAAARGVVTKTVGAFPAKLMAGVVAAVIVIGGGITAWVSTYSQPVADTPTAIVSAAPTEPAVETATSSTTPAVSDTPPETTDMVELISCGSSPGENDGETVYAVEVRYVLASAETAQIELMMNYTPKGDTALTGNEWEAIEISKGSAVVSLVNTYPCGPDGIEYEGVLYPAPTKGRVNISVDGVELIYQDVDFGE
ncbi:MAG: sigma-70 family RNA polymerase sigma factor [Clostridiales bacterium]|jgi:RNA polymerase sigma factor (sigma-70 family)|nr:sigma-70 family RNA polymerase sigma factor [Clostridiales bacterium]